nr:hypothetical protein [Tanacetum cinerariifolium]
MQVTLHDKRIVMQVTLHYEAIVMQGLGDQEDASKQGRMIKDLDADEGVALVDEIHGRNDQDMFDTITTADEVVTIAGVKVSAAAITSQISLDEITLVKALIDIKTSKPKVKGIVIKELNYELAARLQEEERGKVSIEEKSRLFVELMDKRKKHFTRLRAEKIRSKPPTKTQKRNQMCTYLKNMENYKHNQLKSKSFEEIHILFNNTMKWIEAFVPTDTELAAGSEKIAEGSEKAQEGIYKRVADKLEQEDAKRQRMEEENESAKLKRCLEIISEDDDDVTIEATPLSYKSPTIVDYEIYKEGRKRFFKIIRANEMAYDLLRLIRRQINEGYVPE